MNYQQIRKLILYTSFFLLPITLMYFSPVVLVFAGFEGILSQGHVIYAVMFVTSLFLGRAWCSHVCPFGGLQMTFDKVIQKNLVNIKYLRNLKYLIGILWLIIIFYSIFTINISGIDYTYSTNGTGVSVNSLSSLIPYYVVLSIMTLIVLLFGKRAICVYLCPMSILNIIGTKIKNMLKIPSLRLISNPKKCNGCNLCNKVCETSLNVTEMVKQNKMDSIECIMCGECVSVCKNGAIERKFR